MMTRVLSCLVLSSIPLLTPATSAAQESADWQPIPINGLERWSDPGDWWSEHEGVVVAESAGGDALPKWHYLIWDGSLEGDFELQLKYRIFADAPQDAGVNFRVERSRGMNEQGNLIGYQAELDTANLYSQEKFIRQGKLFGNIHDGKRGRMFRRGSRVEINANGKEVKRPLDAKFQPAKVFRRPPEWNVCRIRVVGPQIQLFLNGVLANEIIDRDPQHRSTGDAVALQFRPSDGYRFEVKDLMYRLLSR